MVELDLEVPDGKGAEDLACYAQHFGVRYHEPCEEQIRAHGKGADARVVREEIRIMPCIGNASFNIFSV